jgi:hypothetical protein
MTGSFSARSAAASDETAWPIAAADTARYMRDMLCGLQTIAVRQDQIVLACLLEAAAREASRLADARHP